MDSKRALFLSRMSLSFSRRMGSEQASLAFLLAISSIFLYFFCREATTSTSTPRRMRPRTRWVSRERLSFSRMRRSAAFCSMLSAIFSRSPSFLERSFSVSWRLFMMRAWFSLALRMACLSWLVVSGVLSLAGSFLTMLSLRISMVSRLSMARSASERILACSLMRLAYRSSMRCSSFLSSSISDCPTLGSSASCISFSSWYLRSQRRICRSHSTISLMSSAFSSRMMSMLYSNLVASCSISLSFSMNSLSRLTFSFSSFCFLSELSAMLSLSLFISCCRPFRLMRISSISRSKERQLSFKRIFFCSMIIFLFYRLVTPSWISCSLLFSCTSTVCFFIHSRQSQLHRFSKSSLSRSRLISLFSSGFLPSSLALLMSSSCSLLRRPTSCCFFSLMSWPCLICTSQVITRYFLSFCSASAYSLFFFSNSICDFVFNWSMRIRAISFRMFYSSISFSPMSSFSFCACFSRFEAVFSMVVCSLFWSISDSQSRLASVCNFMMFPSTRFMASSTAFCSWPVSLMFCSVLVRDSFKLLYWAATFSSSAFNSRKISYRLFLILPIIDPWAPSFSVCSSSFRISLRIPASSLRRRALAYRSASRRSRAV